MDKAFFDSLDSRIAAFAERGSLDARLEAVLVLHSGRAIAVERVVETADAHVQVDGRSLADDQARAISVVIPYHQISHVSIGEARPKPGQAGFTLS